MFSAYLEDFRNVKIIINSDIMIDKGNLYALFNDNKIKLNVVGEEYFGNKHHIYLEAEDDIEPMYDYKIICGELQAKLSLGKITRSRLFDEKYFFEEWLGYKYYKTKTIFRVWTPVAKEVKIVLNDQEYRLEYKNKGVWEITVKGDFDKASYYYLVRINNKFIKTVDPYANSSNANHEINYIINFKNTYQMKNSYYNKEDFKYLDAFIYELSVRDATSLVDVDNKGTYRALIDSASKNYGLGYIKNLGITHIQFLPIYAFGGVNELIKDQKQDGFLYNWGYNPMQYMVPSGFFSENPNDPYLRINELKELIDVIHSFNMGVNMDVVFNHVYDGKWYPFEKLVPGYTFRTDDRGYLTNSSWCGNDLKTDHLMIRKLIIDSVKLFQKEYKIDGFRFDLMGLIDIETINQIQKLVKKENPNAMIYGEGWNMDVKLPYEERANMNNCKKMPNVAFFNDYFRNVFKEKYLHGKPCDNNTIFNLMKGYTFGDNKFLSPNQSINYLECHDNYTLFDNITIKSQHLSCEQIKDFVKLGLAINVLATGICFIHAGMEKARTKKLYDNSYNLNDDVNGINWFNSINFTDTLKDLIEIKKKYKVFNYENIEDVNNHIFMEKDLDSNLLMIRYRDYNGTTLQMLISNDYEEKIRFFVPGTKMIFNGEKSVCEDVELIKINKPGLYLFEK